MTVFQEIAALLALAAVVGLIALALRQPLIVAYIAVGIIAGPAALGIAQSDSHLNLLADLGIALLLFLVGLKLDLRLIRSLGPVALATGIGQIAFTSIIGFGICLLLGLDWVTSAYVAVALTFSSTIIIVKLLADKRELNSLHGQIALGFLIVQDIFVIAAMLALSVIGVGTITEDKAIYDIPVVLAAAALIVAGVVLFTRYLANPLTAWLARSSELLVCFAIGWAALLAAGGELVGIGKELGGLLGGVTFASTRYRDLLSARLSSLRDFLLLFFFIALGARLELPDLGAQLSPAVVLSVFVLIGNPFIVVAIMLAMGYRLRTGFLAGLTVAQISEFSLVFMAMGLTLGHVSQSAVGLVTLVGLFTIALCTYMIVYSHTLYEWLAPLLSAIEPAHARREADLFSPHAPFDVVIFGLGRLGSAIAERLMARGRNVLGVDFDPQIVARMRKRGLPVLFGDASDPEFVAELPLEGTRWIVGAMPPQTGDLTQDNARLVLVTTLKTLGYRGRTAVTAHRPEEPPELERQGVDLVLRPFQDAADRTVALLEGETKPMRERHEEEFDEEQVEER